LISPSLLMSSVAARLSRFLSTEIHAKEESVWLL
jgi:hypothetical protein